MYKVLHYIWYVNFITIFILFIFPIEQAPLIVEVRKLYACGYSKYYVVHLGQLISILFSWNENCVALLQKNNSEILKLLIFWELFPGAQGW